MFPDKLCVGMELRDKVRSRSHIQLIGFDIFFNPAHSIPVVNCRCVDIPPVSALKAPHAAITCRPLALDVFRLAFQSF